MTIFVCVKCAFVDVTIENMLIGLHRIKCLEYFGECNAEKELQVSIDTKNPWLDMFFFFFG